MLKKSIEPTIQPYSWQFAADSGPEDRWEAQAASALPGFADSVQPEFADGLLPLTVDTTLTSPDFLYADCSIYDGVRIRMRNRSGCGRLLLCWQTGGQDDWDERQSSSTDINPNSGRLEEYEIRFTGNVPGGSIRRIRLVFPGSFIGETMTVESVELLGESRMERPLVGAIRWDAWSKTWLDLLEGIVLESTFYDTYSYRRPFYGWTDIDSPPGTLPGCPKIIEEENRLAVEYGIDFWAFDWECSGFQKQEHSLEVARALVQPLENYLSLPDDSKPGFSVILMPVYKGAKEKWREYFTDYYIPALTELFANPKYLKVNGNRPVLFVHTSGSMDAQFVEHFKDLAEACTQQGLGIPYLADTDSNVRAASAFGFSALSSYGPATAPGYQTGHRSFADMAAYDKARIRVDTRNSGGYLQFIPGLSPMMDPRPLPYYDKVMNGWGPYDVWFDTPTYKEWEDHFRYFYGNVQRYPGRYPSPGTLLIYAWNELIEGGAGILPTSQFGTMFLEAIRNVKSGEYPDPYSEEFACDSYRLHRSGDWAVEGPSKENAGNFNNCFASTSQHGACLEICEDCIEVQLFSPESRSGFAMEVLVDDGDGCTETIEVKETTSPHSMIYHKKVSSGVMHRIRFRCIRGTFRFDSLRITCRR
jgi:hypothetical protein